jgi:hypothetical protein
MNNVNAAIKAKILEGGTRGGYAAGPIVGKRAVESGQFATIQTRENCITRCKGFESQTMACGAWHRKPRLFPLHSY